METVSKKQIIFSVVMVILAMLIVSATTYFVTVRTIARPTVDNSASVQPVPNQPISSRYNSDVPTTSPDTQLTVDQPEATQEVDSFAVIDPADLIKKGSITWQEPTDIGNIGLTNKELYAGCVMGKCGDSESGSNGIKYLKVGTFVDGKYKDADLVLIVSEIYDGPSTTPVINRIIKKGNDVTLLARGIDEYIINSIKADFSKGSSKMTFDDKSVIEELNFPTDISGATDRQKFKKEDYIYAFFTDAKLKQVFVHPQYGQVWMTDITKAKDKKPTVFELNSYNDVYNKKKAYHDVFSREGFYLKAPDGTAVAYKLVLDIFDKMERVGKLEAVWNGGENNEIAYEENPSGCGAGSYVYNKTLEIDLNNDVVIVGKTVKGDNLYGYKNASIQEVQSLYENNYWASVGEAKVSVEEYLKMNPVVFWVDPFGRTLAFYRADLLSPAECGKPVIYLYPEQPMNVNVQVKPGNGLSYTEPEYGDGWNVFADTQGNLRNLVDGKTYPYLFWEGSGGVFYEQPKQGFMVAKDNLNQFFDEKLSQLGLISKEISDFKEYWIPKMGSLEKPYYFVTFLSKQYIDALAPLSINPKPETVIRVLMDYKGLDAPASVQPMSLVAPERKGFTAVEWGGFLK